MVILSGVYEPFAVPSPTATHLQCLYVSVADAQAHRDRAAEHGAEILSEPQATDYGAKVYTARDCAGYHWIFAETLSR